MSVPARLFTTRRSPAVSEDSVQVLADRHRATRHRWRSYRSAVGAAEATDPSAADASRRQRPGDDADGDASSDEDHAKDAGPDHRSPRHGAAGTVTVPPPLWVPPPGPPLSRRAQVAQDGLAGLLGRLELGGRWIDPTRTPDRDHAATICPGIGEVHAVVAHALGELDHLVLHLRIDRDPVSGTARAEERPAGLEGLLHLFGIDAVATHLDGSPASAEPSTGDRIGHVDAVLAHAARELQLRRLRVERRGWSGETRPRRRSPAT